MVTLVLSGALAGGCNQRSQVQLETPDPQGTNVTVITNNTYVEGRGYYHAPFHAWFEYPYNYYRPGYGYYYGGNYSSRPYISDIFVSRPSRSVSIGSFSSGGGSSHIGSAAHSSSVSRGGFGGISHGSIGA